MPHKTLLLLLHDIFFPFKRQKRDRLTLHKCELIQLTKVFFWTLSCSSEKKEKWNVNDLLTKRFFVWSLKYGFVKKSFMNLWMNAPLVSCPFPVITFVRVCCCIHSNMMSENGQLKRVAFIINDFLRNPHFSDLVFFRRWG